LESISPLWSEILWDADWEGERKVEKASKYSVYANMIEMDGWMDGWIDVFYSLHLTY
jgi:hypothetical protein